MKAEGGLDTGDVLLGKYRIELLLGRGGMGLVYRARHLHLNEQFAIKVLRTDVQLDEEAVERFKREAQAAVKLKSEHVARIHDVGVFPDGSPYMVMEFLAGADLGSLVDTNGPTDVPTAVDLILQACDALAEAHAAGIVHRDVKPSNLFVSTHADGSHILKILDFGISKSATGTDLSLTQTASVLGTPAYMSPEQMRSARRVDARTDIWSLGTVLYELVEGRRPFRAETFSEMCVMAAVDPHDPMTLAPELEPIVARCLAKQPDGRFQSIAELGAALAPFARNPARANHYVVRMQRVLGRSVHATPPPGTLPVITVDRPAASQPLMPMVGTLSDTTADPLPRGRSSRKGIWLGLIALAVAGATAAVLVTSSKNRAAEDEPEPEHVIRIQAVGGSSAASGSAAPPMPPDASVTAAATGLDAGSTTPKVTTKKPGGKMGGKRTVGKGSAGAAKGSAATPPPPPPDAGSAKKPCNVWESRTGCR